jgi:AraC-like DNA-binding protein
MLQEYTVNNNFSGPFAFRLTAGRGLYHPRCVLSHRLRQVSPVLAPHVEHLWVARGYLPGRWRNMILPDGAMELIVNLGDPQKLCGRNNLIKDTVFRHSWISGERTSPIVIDEIGYVHLIGVRLRAGGAWPFLGIPLREFTDQVLELETIFGREMEDLRDQLGEASDDDSRFDLLEAWLVRRARSRTHPTRSVSYALRMIQNGLDAVPIGKIADTIGISHKHLLREFDRCVGLTPKLFARLCAFQRVIRSVGQKAEVDWAGTAATCGYHDQAHLIHEFRAFSGLKPSNYLTKRGPFLNYLEIE